jgi:cardiolipin synthase
VGKILRLIFGRAFLVGASIAVQMAALIMIIWGFSDYFVYFYFGCMLLSMIAVLGIINDKSNPAYKIATIIPILIFPIFGGLFYLIFAGNRTGKRTEREMQRIREKVQTLYIQDTQVLEKIEKHDKGAANQARYIEKFSFFPVSENTETEYLTPGEIKFIRLKEELRKAKDYIFLEYFIIEEGQMWQAVLDILIQKVEQGVDVRVIYDDVGCLFKLPYRYDKKLQKMGIKCHIFNPVVPFLSVQMNNRDHRKIVVIDGHTAFTGGINLADEYINAYERFGYWKDSAIMVKGEGAWAFTVMFLSLWEVLDRDEENYDRYKPQFPQREVIKDGYVQPFTDSPLDGETVSEMIYLNMISKAKAYVYINTPYLILDHEMMTILCMAAKSGVDVRIVMPHISDKPLVHEVTQSHYSELIESGVRIYEYTPGFMHAKTLVTDDEFAVVGTINLDYRSLYLHFECGVWLYKTQSVFAVKEDFLRNLKVSTEILLEDCKAVKWYRKLGRSVLSVFKPLM